MPQKKSGRDYPLSPTPPTAKADKTYTETKDNFRTKQSWYPNRLTPEAGEGIRVDDGKRKFRAVGVEANRKAQERVDALTSRSMGVDKQNNSFYRRKASK